MKASLSDAAIGTNAEEELLIPPLSPISPTPIPISPIDMKGLSKVLIADMQILGAAFFFGIGFIGQRAVSMEGVGPMTCNAFRFGLSTIIIIVFMPWIPSFPAEHAESDSDDSDGENLEQESLRTNNYEQNDIRTTSIKKPDSDQFVIKQLIGSSQYTKFFAGAKRTVIFWGTILGVLNFFASGFQQWGIAMTTANKVSIESKKYSYR
jgi:hypothetical protein